MQNSRCNRLGAHAWQVGMGELLGSRSVRIGMCLFLLQQASGINAIVYFSSSVFAQARRPCFPALSVCGLGPACQCLVHAPQGVIPFNTHNPVQSNRLDVAVVNMLPGTCRRASPQQHLRARRWA